MALLSLHMKINIYNPDYNMVNTTIGNWNNGNIDIKYKFQNQKFSTLAMEF